MGWVRKAIKFTAYLLLTGLAITFIIVWPELALIAALGAVAAALVVIAGICVFLMVVGTIGDRIERKYK